MYKYKNITEEELVIVGVGTIPAGAVFTVNTEINNPNFKRVNDTTTEQVTNTNNNVEENAVHGA